MIDDILKSIKKAQVPAGEKEEKGKAMPKGMPAEPAVTEPAGMKVPPVEDEEIAELTRMLEEGEEKVPPEEKVFKKEPLVRTPEKELAEIVEVPKVFKRLGPIDRMMFYQLERARKDAISRGDLNELRRIHEEEERILEKYVKEVVKSDELSGFSFAVRQIQGHFLAQRKLGKYIQKAYDKICDVLHKMGVMIFNASLLESESSEWEENPETGYTEWVLNVGIPISDATANIIVRANVDEEGVKVHPYFYDFLGNSYSFDEVSIRKFIGLIREKPADEWLESVGWTEEKDLIKLDSVLLDELTKMDIEEGITEKLKEVESNTGWLYLSDIKFKGDVVQLVYSSVDDKIPSKVFLPDIIKFADKKLEKENMYVKGKKVVAEYRINLLKDERRIE